MLLGTTLSRSSPIPCEQARRPREAGHGLGFNIQLNAGAAVTAMALRSPCVCLVVYAAAAPQTRGSSRGSAANTRHHWGDGHIYPLGSVPQHLTHMC